MFANAHPDACTVCAVLRVSEYDRVSRRIVPLASRSFPARPAVHSAGRNGNLDVRSLVDQPSLEPAESTGEDDGIRLPCDDGGVLLASRIRTQSLLRRSEPCDASTAMAHCT